MSISGKAMKLSQMEVNVLSLDNHTFNHNPQVKRLLEDEDEDHLNSSWANPKQLATGLQGLSSVSWKPK